VGKKSVRLGELFVERGGAGADPALAVLDALDCLRLAVTVYDSAERLIYANAHYNYLFRALPRYEHLIGKSYADLVALELSCGEIAPEDENGRYIAMRRAQLHADGYAPLDIALFDGRVVEIKTRRTRDGGWIAIWTDATQARAFTERVQKRLAKSESEIKKQAMYLADLTRKLDEASSEADSAKTMLLRTMSHELKTPLNAILGFADLMQTASDRLSAAQVADYSGLIHGAGENLLRLINQILDLTKVAAGRFPLSRIALPAATLFHDAMEACVARAREKHLTIAIENCDAVVHADEGAAIAMVGNLVENAVNFTQAGGAITLSASREGDVVRLRIADNGPGVAAADLARITEPFEQASRGMTGKPQGAGLGLPLVKALAELHGGRLALESDAGKGFVAIIELPAA
jgi:two-component system cell cycle sensor histidine kinase PleC